jgi:hypothetical protein
MADQKIENLKNSIDKLKNKNIRIYFFVQDTKGNPKASIFYIYHLALTLKKQGYESIILHEKPDYVGVSGWLDEEYMTITHMPIEGQNLAVTPEDLLIIPELFGFIMNQVTKLPCGKIVLCQSYDYLLETLQPGESWSQLGFLKCITTSEAQKDVIQTIMRGISFDILEPFIPDYFSKGLLPPKPIIGIHTRDPRDTANVIKSFYLKFPQYRWVTFRDLRNMSNKDFSFAIKDCFLSVWIDETGGYGTFPLESMKTGVPVLGVVPNVMPYWLNTENGVWINNKIQITDFIADFLQNWLEDNIKETLYVEMDKTVQKLPTMESFENKAIELFNSYVDLRLSLFEEQLEKLKETEEYAN